MLNLGQIVNSKNNLKSDQKFIKTSKVDLVTPTSKKIDLTKKKAPATAKNTQKQFTFDLEHKKKMLQKAELELARREKHDLDQKKEELKRELEITRLQQTMQQKKNL
jgi:hypothetical protein